MKKTNKKGFTLVELVIVIAVIAILAAVLIPVFTNIIGEAKEKAALADARNVYEQYIVDEAKAQNEIPTELIIEADNSHYFVVVNGEFKTEAIGTLSEAEAVEGFANYDFDKTETSYKCKIYIGEKQAETSQTDNP